ncbi:MAG TPA: ABC transporter substrate-binding protein [Anaerolineae bacterium]
MKHKVWLLVTVLVMLLVVSACGGAAEQAPAPAQEEAPAADSSAADEAEEVADEAMEEEEAMAEEAPASDEPIKIGFLAALSSVAASSAQDMVDGHMLYWEQHDFQVAGRPIEVLVEDTAGDPDTALNKARLLVEQREVDMLFGTLFANEGLAVAEYIKDTGTPTFYATSSADDLTQRTPVTNLLRPGGWASSAPHHVFGEWVRANTDCESVYTIGSDYAFGHEVIGGFVNTFTDNGGAVQEQIWNPVAEADFSSYLAAIQEAQPNCVFVLEVGASAIRFIQAWSDFGLAGEIPVYFGEVPLDQSILRGVDPPEIAEGYISVGHYAEGRDSAATQDFVEAYEARYGLLPSYYSVGQYTAAQWVAAAIESLNGNIDDSQALIDAVKAIELDDSPLGPVRLDELGNPIQNMYIRQVALREDGRPWNIVIDEIPEVSQFYKYDQAEFLAQPVYSRDYQGIDWP